MVVTEFGIVISARAEQNSNALFPMVVTELGIVISARAEQDLNAPFSMFITVEGIETDVMALFTQVINVVLSLLNNKVPSVL